MRFAGRAAVPVYVGVADCLAVAGHAVASVCSVPASVVAGRAAVSVCSVPASAVAEHAVTVAVRAWLDRVCSVAERDGLAFPPAAPKQKRRFREAETAPPC
jgi:hypothetical protein